MPRKRKFRPRITKIKLNPEQAVLTCTCFDAAQRLSLVEEGTGYRALYMPSILCQSGTRATFALDWTPSSGPGDHSSEGAMIVS